jgi:hypothetical protein
VSLATKFACILADHQDFRSMAVLFRRERVTTLFSWPQLGANDEYSDGVIHSVKLCPLHWLSLPSSCLSLSPPYILLCSIHGRLILYHCQWSRSRGSPWWHLQHICAIVDCCRLLVIVGLTCRKLPQTISGCENRPLATQRPHEKEWYQYCITDLLLHASFILHFTPSHYFVVILRISS